MRTTDQATNAGTWLGGLVAFLSGLNLSEWGVVAGIALGAGSFLVNLWFKWHLLQLAKRKKGVEFNVD